MADFKIGEQKTDSNFEEKLFRLIEFQKNKGGNKIGFSVLMVVGDKRKS